MSQTKRRDDIDGHRDRGLQASHDLSLGQSQALHPPKLSPRIQSSSPPLSNTIIPRDYLGSRFDAQNSRPSTAPFQRKPNPSPLQSSHLPHHPSSLVAAANMPSKSNPYSSRPVLDHNTDVKGQNQNSDTDGNSWPLKEKASANKNVQSPSQTQGAFQPVAELATQPYREQAVQLLPDSPTSITSSPTSESRQPPRTALPRNSSIDSAISSISSNATHSHKSSLDSGNANMAEIKALIITAGSPENLVSYLLKEKQHAASQNAQLWKLVDKQRLLLLGLNKDLERITKEKEKYRKKLKEIQALPPSSAEKLMRNECESPAPVKVIDTLSTPSSPKDDEVFSSPEPELGRLYKNPDNPLEHVSNDAPAVSPKVHHLRQQRDGQLPSRILDFKQSTGVKIPYRSSSQPILDELRAGTSTVENGVTPTQQNLKQPLVTSKNEVTNQHRIFTNTKSHVTLPSLALTEPSPIVDKHEKSYSATRKAPPAPLKLSQTMPVSNTLHARKADDHSDSDYDDILEPDETPTHERGRRRTREDDDRDREAAAQKEQDARSRSKKMKGAITDLEASNEMPTVTSPDLSLNGMPSSPGQMATQSSHTASKDQLSLPHSLASTLQSNADEFFAIKERHIFLPPPTPGLPCSPRPMDRPLGSPMPRLPRESSGVNGPVVMSPRGIGVPFPLSPRAPKHPIPLPPHASLANISIPSTKPLEQNSWSSETNDAHAKAALTTGGDSQADLDSSRSNQLRSRQIYDGFVDGDYPDLLLPPNAVPLIHVVIASSRLHPPRNSQLAPKLQEEDMVFVFSIVSRSNSRELWRVEKGITAIPQLDQQIKSACKFAGKLPDRKVFSGHSPAIVDARRTALNTYFAELLDTPMDEKAGLVLCQFLTADAMPAREDVPSFLRGLQGRKSTMNLGSDGKPKKEGYLTKRGKNFGGWKSRFFELQGAELRYYETPGGHHLGTIKLYNARIGKQSEKHSPVRSEDDVENQYRHAFLILEPKRKDSNSLVRHVLCAESDEERDEWVEVLLLCVDGQTEDDSPKKPVSKRVEDGKSHVMGFEAKMRMYSPDAKSFSQNATGAESSHPEFLRGLSYEDTIPGSPPLGNVSATDRLKDGTPSPSSTSSANTANNINHLVSDSHPTSSLAKSISGPTNATVIQDVGAWGNKPTPSKEHKKRNLFNFHRQRSSSELRQPTQGDDSSMNGTPSATATTTLTAEYSGPVRAVFGLPLAEAVEVCPPRGIGVNLPAVVYRCIEYLRAKDAAGEEGIFRLSGSNVVVRSLKERFNTEGDINLLVDEQYYDIHAVASLFKSYLRELPSSVLTRELHLDFLHVLELEDKPKKVAAFNQLTNRLPSVNRSLLKALSEYLLEVINKSEKNKMNVRNVGIVFSPTLNIPAPIFSMFLTDFDAIFEVSNVVESPVRSIELPMPKLLTPEEIRSPRHQMFSDLPTPAYNQTTFTKNTGTGSFAAQTNDTALKPVSNTSTAHDVGFIPMQPSYESRTYVSDPFAPSPAHHRYQKSQQSTTRPEYGSMTRMIAPDNAPTEKAKRRESSMLFMGTI